MVNKNLRRNEFNGPESREKNGDYLKWTNYTYKINGSIVKVCLFTIFIVVDLIFSDK